MLYFFRISCKQPYIFTQGRALIPEDEFGACTAWVDGEQDLVFKFVLWSTIQRIIITVINHYVCKIYHFGPLKT